MNPAEVKRTQGRLWLVVLALPAQRLCIDATLELSIRPVRANSPVVRCAKGSNASLKARCEIRHTTIRIGSRRASGGDLAPGASGPAGGSRTGDAATGLRKPRGARNGVEGRSAAPPARPEIAIPDVCTRISRRAPLSFASDCASRSPLNQASDREIMPCRVSPTRPQLLVPGGFR